jgi:hypothetical protein
VQHHVNRLNALFIWRQREEGWSLISHHEGRDSSNEDRQVWSDKKQKLDNGPSSLVDLVDEEGRREQVASEPDKQYTFEFFVNWEVFLNVADEVDG